MARFVVIGASAGGIEALQTVVEALPADFPAPILVVVHVSHGHESVLPKMLDRIGELEALHPYNGQDIQPGKIYVAPSNYHMVVIDHHIQLKNTPRENRHRPAIDPLFRSAAEAHGSEVIGVILSGALDDGTGGMIAIEQCGGVAIVQDPDDAMIASMPSSVMRYVDVDYSLPATEIARILVELTQSTVVSEEKILATPATALDITDTQEVMMHNLHNQPGELTPYACPECDGNLWRSAENGFEQYWCHIGHRYTKRTLLAEKKNISEMTLFEALRNLKEEYNLYREMLNNINDSDEGKSSKELTATLNIRQKQLKLLQQIIAEQE